MLLKCHGNITLLRGLVVEPFAVDEDVGPVACSSPATICNAVVLPQPDGPTTATTLRATSFASPLTEQASHLLSEASVDNEDFA